MGRCNVYPTFGGSNVSLNHHMCFTVYKSLLLKKNVLIKIISTLVNDGHNSSFIHGYLSAKTFMRLHP